MLKSRDYLNSPFLPARSAAKARSALSAIQWEPGGTRATEPMLNQ
jgi:hypothetical protein